MFNKPGDPGSPESSLAAAVGLACGARLPRSQLRISRGAALGTTFFGGALLLARGPGAFCSGGFFSTSRLSWKVTWNTREGTESPIPRLTREHLVSPWVQHSTQISLCHLPPSALIEQGSAEFKSNPEAPAALVA